MKTKLEAHMGNVLDIALNTRPDEYSAKEVLAALASRAVECAWDLSGDDLREVDPVRYNLIVFVDLHDGDCPVPVHGSEVDAATVEKLKNRDKVDMGEIFREPDGQLWQDVRVNVE